MNLSKGMSVEEALSSLNTKTVEGLQSMDSIYELMHMTGHNVKSIDFMYDVIYNQKKVDNVLKEITG